jgi:NADPH:quinone reductase-like Zn-dependent oxidoreductase
MLSSPPYSYDHLVDYRESDWPEKVHALTGGKGIHYAYDCIAEGESVQLVCRTLAKGAKLATVRSKANKAFRADNLPTEPIYGAVWEGLGETIQYMGFSVPSPPEARAFAVSFYGWLCDGGKLKPNPIRVMPGGLEKIVEDGFELLGSGAVSSREHSRTEPWMKPVSAEKLVYKIGG